MRTLYDSTNAADIPATAQMVGGYVDGIYAWTSADWARFPRAVKVRIAVMASTNDGEVLDVEPGDATPAEAPGWVRMRRQHGVDPTIYCNLSAVPLIKDAFIAAGEPQPHYWVARYDNVPDLPAGTVAKQYINDPASGGHFDLSSVADYWPGIDPAPTAGPASTGGSTPPISEEDYTMDRVPKGGAAGGVAKSANHSLAVSMLREHDVIIAPGNMPVVLYGAYNWGWSGADDKATPGTGGNPVADPNQPKVIYPKGSYSFIVPKGTGKVDLVYWADDDFSVTVAPR